LEKYIRPLAREKQEKTWFLAKNTVPQKSAKSSAPIDTREEISKVAKVWGGDRVLRFVFIRFFFAFYPSYPF